MIYELTVLFATYAGLKATWGILKALVNAMREPAGEIAKNPSKFLNSIRELFHKVAEHRPDAPLEKTREELIHKLDEVIAYIQEQPVEEQDKDTLASFVAYRDALAKCKSARAISKRLNEIERTGTRRVMEELLAKKYEDAIHDNAAPEKSAEQVEVDEEAPSSQENTAEEAKEDAEEIDVTQMLIEGDEIGDQALAYQKEIRANILSLTEERALLSKQKTAELDKLEHQSFAALEKANTPEARFAVLKKTEQFKQQLHDKYAALDASLEQRINLFAKEADAISQNLKVTQSLDHKIDQIIEDRNNKIAHTVKHFDTLIARAQRAGAEDIVKALQHEKTATIEQCKTEASEQSHAVFCGYAETVSIQKELLTTKDARTEQQLQDLTQKLDAQLAEINKLPIEERVAENRFFATLSKNINCQISEKTYQQELTIRTLEHTVNQMQVEGKAQTEEYQKYVERLNRAVQQRDSFKEKIPQIKQDINDRLAHLAQEASDKYNKAVAAVMATASQELAMTGTLSQQTITDMRQCDELKECSQKIAELTVAKIFNPQDQAIETQLSSLIATQNAMTEQLVADHPDKEEREIEVKEKEKTLDESRVTSFKNYSQEDVSDSTLLDKMREDLASIMQLQQETLALSKEPFVQHTPAQQDAFERATNAANTLYVNAMAMTLVAEKARSYQELSDIEQKQYNTAYQQYMESVTHYKDALQDISYYAAIDKSLEHVNDLVEAYTTRISSATITTIEQQEEHDYYTELAEAAQDASHETTATTKMDRETRTTTTTKTSYEPVR